MHTRDRVSVGIGLALLVGGAVAVGTGAFPAHEASALAERVWGILLFVVAMTMVAELSSRAGLFDVAARVVIQTAGSRSWRLWLLISAFTLACTIFLSLDTTVVLLTPMVVVLSRRIGLDPKPFALTVVWLANTGSMLLPISNLTNLLAANKFAQGSPAQFASLLWPVAVVCAVVPLALIALVFRRELGAAPTLAPNSPLISSGRPFAYAAQLFARRPLLTISAVVVSALIIALLAGVEVWIPATIAALALIAAHALTDRSALTWRLVPLPMIVLTAGLFLGMGAVGSMFVHEAVGNLLAQDDSPATLLGTAALGAGGANLINNLPAYLALEPLAHSPATMVALLVGVNAGPLITPWASLATLLWHERLVATGVHVSWSRYMLLGAVAAPLIIIAAWLALLVQF